MLTSTYWPYYTEMKFVQGKLQKDYGSMSKKDL